MRLLTGCPASNRRQTAKSPALTIWRVLPPPVRSLRTAGGRSLQYLRAAGWLAADLLRDCFSDDCDEGNRVKHVATRRLTHPTPLVSTRQSGIGSTFPRDSGLSRTALLHPRATNATLAAGATASSLELITAQSSTPLGSCPQGRGLSTDCELGLGSAGG